MRTKLHENDGWTTCLSEPKIESDFYNVFCEKPTVAKFFEIFLDGEAGLYLHEASVAGIFGEYGLSFYRKFEF